MCTKGQNIYLSYNRCWNCEIWSKYIFLFKKNKFAKFKTNYYLGPSIKPQKCLLLGIFSRDYLHYIVLGLYIQSLVSNVILGPYLGINLPKSIETTKKCPYSSKDISVTKHSKINLKSVLESDQC